MTNEEKILERLDALTEELREVKEAVRPYVELKNDIEPLLNDMVVTAIGKLSGLDRSFKLEDVGDMLGQVLVSSKNVTDALKTLNKFIEFKKDFEPYSKEIFKELVQQMETSLHGFDPEELKELIRQFIANMGNLADGLKMLGSVVEMKKDATGLTKLAFNDAVERLEELKGRGTFEAFSEIMDMTERVGNRMQDVNFQEVKPIRGVWGMMTAMKRPEVQEGLGVLIELSTVMTALKKEGTEAKSI